MKLPFATIDSDLESLALAELGELLVNVDFLQSGIISGEEKNQSASAQAIRETILNYPKLLAGEDDRNDKSILEIIITCGLDHRAGTAVHEMMTECVQHGLDKTSIKQRPAFAQSIKDLLEMIKADPTFTANYDPERAKKFYEIADAPPQPPKVWKAEDFGVTRQ